MVKISMKSSETIYNHTNLQPRIKMRLTMHFLWDTPVSELKRRNKIVFLFYLFLILCPSLQIDFLELGKTQFNGQGVAHNSVPRTENIDSRIM